MIDSSIWVYVGWCLLGLFVAAILGVTIALLIDRQRTKNQVQALPSLEVISESEKKDIFDAEAKDLNKNSNVRRGRRSVESTVITGNSEKSVEDSSQQSTTNFFDDEDDEFQLTAGRD